METVIIMSVVSVAAALVTLSRVLGLRRILRNATLVDVIFTVGAFVLLAGTLTGALVAVLSGLLMAVVLTLLKRLDGIAGRLTARLRASRMAAEPVRPHGSQHGLPDDEFKNGVWIYNL